ncbi:MULTISPECIES: hypothetical protein [Bradyrhizobium]|uniref:hypothetical protein n=1 Tax=Bradyrhizobium TaxID=374 RepID=UPI00155E6CFB|nr:MULTISPECIES: hypothetical protein [Bradyrhizobium]MDD1520738.1 hypothetical protein [Bradyrhizobium sp. WBAH30]MDD1545789.1 hypothetical protein [Bradyrhizobium sp. WBAH41]MDD1558950.1 hypothetical protein [Bradyrhizobium sp. WBAH23]MDD1566400.1 hypothetical protein [Bradyrhizobium sp. WBAH33]MDD1591993.1 hypothetical protein [Bradyrhizobium sp. WBAH42]
MSEQSGPNAGISNATAAPLHADGALEAAASMDGPSIAPDHEAPPKPDAPKIEASNAEAPRIEVPNIGAKLEAEPKAEPKPGKLIVMAPTEWSSNRFRDREDFGPDKNANEARAAGKRRLAGTAAVVALAACVGAISGALTTARVMQFATNPAPVPMADNSALAASVGRIDADVIALKASLDNTSKTGVDQFNRTTDRLDKLEKAQAEPMAKLAKLSETVDKLRTAQAAVPAPTAAAQAATPAATPPKVEASKLPMVDGWRLRDVANGGALIEGREGLYEVYAGDPVPGLGRVDAIRRQDGRWVVVTSKGLIVAR